MGILNYTTKIDPEKSVAEIQSILARSGARSVSVQYQGGQPSAIFFSIDMNDSPINFRLPSNWQGVLMVMNKDKKIPRPLKNNNQAMRVAWRIVKDWVEAQLAIIESGQAEFAEAFTAYATNSRGETLYQQLTHNPQLLLGN
jgi:hypothetical protein